MLAGALISLLLGLLLGLERERSRSGSESFAGIRTFPLLALCGYLGAWLGKAGVTLALPAVLLAVGALALASYLRTADSEPGVTTEVTAVVAALLGAAVSWGEPVAAASIAVVVTLLLTLKAPLHRIAGSVTEDEILAILKFGVVSVVLLPLLPTRPVGPYGALVPRHIGFVVVVLCGVSLGGYLLVRWLGAHAGWPLAGALGGLVSSTAVSLSFASKARSEPGLASPLAHGIVLASTVLYARGLVLIAVFDPALGRHLAPRLGVLFAIGLAFASLAYWRRRGGGEPGAIRLGNPVELGRAVLLALLFAAILVGSRAAQETMGTRGLWVAGFVGGLVDVDSVAVAAARLHQQQITSLDAASGSYLVATLANLMVKGVVVLAVGGWSLFRRAAPAFAALGAASVGALLIG